MQDSYDITGVDLALSKFFYRASQELFQDLSTGDYRVDTSAGKQTLVITNQEILSAAEAFQVGYVLDFTATKYETQWNVDINTLKDRYNQLVDSTQELWEYIRKTGFISDDTTIDLILPQLDINEVWVRGESGYVGMPINDIQTSIKDAIQKYLLEVVYPTIDGYVEATSKPALDEYVKTTIKPEIDDFTDAKEVELQDLKDILANQLQELVDNALADRGVIPNDTDWNTLSYGTWYVSDLNGSNYTNHPNLEDTEGVGVVLVTDSQGGSAKVIRYYSMQKKMHFKIKNATGVWSEWSALSAGGGVRYEYTQVNHGFLFTPVMLDGISNEWVKATTNGADGIAVYISRDRFELIMNGSVQIPNSAKDVNGDAFVNDEYYFLSNNIAGGLDREKPIGVFQPMIRTYLDEQGRMWAEVEVDTPVDLVPRVLNEEAEILGIQMEVDNRLQTESKTVVGAINESVEKTENVEKGAEINAVRPKIFWNTGNSVSIGDIKFAMNGFRFMGKHHKTGIKNYYVEHSYLGSGNFSVCSNETDVEVCVNKPLESWVGIFAVKTGENDCVLKMTPFMQVSSVGGDYPNRINLAKTKEGTWGTAAWDLDIKSDVKGKDVLVITKNNKFYGKVHKVQQRYGTSSIITTDILDVVKGDYLLIAPSDNEYSYLGSAYIDSAEFRNRSDDGKTVMSYGIAHPQTFNLSENFNLLPYNCISPLSSAMITNVRFLSSNAKIGQSNVLSGGDTGHMFQKHSNIRKWASVSAALNTGLIVDNFDYKMQLGYRVESEVVNSTSDVQIRVFGFVEN